jgi:peptide/nickel transport system permease protein
MRNRTTDRLDQALELVRQGNLVEARALLSHLLDRDPADERAWLALSFAVPERAGQVDALRRLFQARAASQATQPALPPAARSAAAAARPEDRLDTGPAAEAPRPPHTALRVARYVGGRALTLGLMVSIGVFLAIVVINFGGYIDDIARAQINEALNFLSLSMRGATAEELMQATEEARWQMEEAAGLHEPFLARCVRWWWKAVRFDWGQTHLRITGFPSSASEEVRGVLLDALPNTLLLAGTANFLLFFASLALALHVSQRHGSFLDRLLVGLSPISTIPNWMWGIVLVVIFAGTLRVLPFNGMFDALPPATPLGYVPIVLRHMILPVAAIFLSLFFQSVYAWRTYFLVHSGEDYVEMGRAQGLPQSTIGRRYLLRPVLPYIMTSFALLLITFWQGSIVLEVLFDWPGIGPLFLEAVRVNDRDVTVATIVMFAYLLALSVFVLDILYAVVDPRVRITGGERTLRTASTRRVARAKRQEARGKRQNAPGREQNAWRRPWGAVESSADPPPASAPAGLSAGALLRGAGRRVRAFGSFMREMARYPSALLGLAFVVALVGISVYTVIALPYPEAVRQWLPAEPSRYKVPPTAQPEWVNFFRRDKLPPTIALNSRDGTAHKEVVTDPNGSKTITLTYPIDYPYRYFPQDVSVRFDATFQEKRPFVEMHWSTPDGREMDLDAFSIVSGQNYMASLEKSAADKRGRSQDAGWLKGTGNIPPQEILFWDAFSDEPRAVAGQYRLEIIAYTFEPGSDVDAEVVVLGQVYGLAGTDDQRRDLMVGLQWGAPVALVIGLVGAIVTAVLSMAVAAAGAWFGGWVDNLVQRITEVNMIVPALPMALMIYYAYSKSVWVILGVIVLFSIFGSGVKNYRAVFLQVKEAPYMEAARAYGASNGRMVRSYLVPRILPLLLPQLVFLIPTYVFFEATLTYLNVSDPKMPTWGKIIYDALTKGAYAGKVYWVLEPTLLIILTGLAFALVGFALDSILNPRLRSR